MSEGHEWAEKTIIRVERLMLKVEGLSWQKALETVLEVEYAFNHPEHADPNEPARAMFFPKPTKKDE